MEESTNSMEALKTERQEETWMRDARKRLLAYRNRPSVDVGYVEPQLLGIAHIVWEEQNAKIYLGSERSARADVADELDKVNIRAIVNCTPSFPDYHSTNISYCRVAIADMDAAHIIPHLTGATAFLKHHLCLGHSVLVHCEMGVSRSATVVMAYLIRYHDMTREQAYDHVKRRRPKINPNPGFWEQLQIWQEKGRNPVSKSIAIDEEWARESQAVFSTCHEMDDYQSTCFGPCLSHPIEHFLLTSLDFVWGRGILPCDLEWFAALCKYYQQEKTSAPSVQQQAMALLQDPNSKFQQAWSAEIYPEQIERVRLALTEDT